MSKQRRGKRSGNMSSFLYSLSPLHSLCLPQGHSLCQHMFTYAGGATVKNCLPMQETQEMWVQSLDQEYPPGVGNGNLAQCSCWGKSHGQRSLAAYSPWSRKESDLTD